MSTPKRLIETIPLIEELEQMTGYTKFMKDLVNKKRTVSFKSMDNVHHCNAIASRLYVLLGVSNS